MKRAATFLLLFLGYSFCAKADHITGGQMSYSFIGISNGMYQYNVSFKVFMRCNSGRQFNNPTIVSVFNKASSERVADISVPLLNSETISLNNANPCITDPPVVCYVVGIYSFMLSVPPSSAGYILSSQVNYRIAGISNLTSNYGLIGAAYTAEIPGTAAGADLPKNNSAAFIGSDLVIVCANNSFSYSFAALDNDGDELRYSFCNAYQSSSAGGSNAQNVPTGAPPYSSVPYGSGFASSSPLGKEVKIDPKTGLITGVAPHPGVYVVTVCVDEIRNGVVIATQRKDLQINIASCTIASASLLPTYMLCRDTKTISISNRSNSPLIKTYNWELINASGVSIYSSTDASLNYTFSDTGTYTVKLFINKRQDCSDSARSSIKVYPGFVPAFDVRGICVNKPTLFSDVSVSVLGTVNYWNWDFADNGVSDKSEIRNPSYTYTSLGIRNVRMIVGNTFGCVDTLYKPVNIIEKPPITLGFRDTLICVKDQLQLKADGMGDFSWTPIVNLFNGNTQTPVVSPPSTMYYYVDLNDNGCRNRDSVLVRVVDHVTVSAMPDTIICAGDAVQLKLISDGLAFSWAPATQIANPGIAFPIVTTKNTTTYEVTAIIGGCTAKDQVTVKTIPYPVANAGPDTLICYKTTAILNGSTNASSLLWSPASTLSSTTSLHPVARPESSINYVLTVYDNKGCPKPGRDTVLVTVLPPIRASAGNDTSVVVNQPLQLNASGGVRYSWVPAIGLSNAAIANPLIMFSNAAEVNHYTVKVYNEAGCSELASINIKVFRSQPDIFVPNAFTPGKSQNNLFRPIPVGILQIDYFRVYNRLGQLLFSSSQTAKGWDGTASGKLQSPDTYVWMVQGKDYTGRIISKKGTVILVR